MRGQPVESWGNETFSSIDCTNLSRFIFDRKHFSSLNKRVKPAAFNDPNLRVSSFWIDILTDHQIWHIGDTVAGGPRKKPTIARADFRKSDVLDLKLSIEADPKPHARHVEVCSWPTEKDARILLAIELCVRSQLLIREAK